LAVVLLLTIVTAVIVAVADVVTTVIVAAAAGLEDTPRPWVSFRGSCARGRVKQGGAVAVVIAIIITPVSLVWLRLPLS
jgi:hypothetical protein